MEPSTMGIELNTIVENVTELTRARWSALASSRGVFVTLRRSLRDGLPPCDGDAGTVRDALVRLVLDATDAMPDGGTLTIRTDSARRGDGKREAFVEVRDTGARPARDLAALDDVLRHQGGRLTVEAAPEGGTAVRLAFAASGHRPRMFVMPEPMKILLIDDDAFILDSTQIVLELDGHEVAIASSGAEGVEAAARAAAAGTPFDVVFTDLGMPGMNGHEVAAALKAARPETRVVLMTGWGDGAGRGDADFLLGKPPQPEAINRVLAECAPGRA
jgi:CheY-like chemotaxis protein